MKAVLARIKAAKLLGFSGDNHYLSQAWPKFLCSKVVIKLQGDDEIPLDLIKTAIDRGKIHKRYEETDFMGALNPVIAADEFIALLKEISKEPSESIRAWYESTTPQTEAAGGIGTGNHAPDERQNQLHIFIWRAHQVLNEQKKPTAQQLWNEIQHHHETHDTDKIIQEVNGEQILWCSGYGNEQRLQRKTFDKTLSNIRKTPPL